jgi:uncharacterized membrane protein HdeD (DUF308 family)
MGGMNGRTDLFTSLIVGIAGIAMIVLHNHLDIMAWIVIMIGVMFIIPGVFSVLIGALSKERKSTTSVLAGIGALALGVIMCAMPEQFAGIMVTLFGVLLIIIGGYHLCFVAWLARPFVLPFYYYIIPVLLIVTGVIVMCTSVRTINSIVLLVTGIAFVCSAISSLMEWVATHPSHRNDDSQLPPVEKTE